MDKFFTAFSHRIAFWAGQPASFIIAFGIVLVWAVTGPIFQFSDTWQLVINTGTTIVTFLMVFLIQNAQNRDASAMQAKLDEIIRALDKGRNEFIGIENLTESDLEKIKKQLEEECGTEADHRKSIDALIARR